MYIIWPDRAKRSKVGEGMPVGAISPLLIPRFRTILLQTLSAMGTYAALSGWFGPKKRVDSDRPSATLGRRQLGKEVGDA